MQISHLDVPLPDPVPRRRLALIVPEYRTDVYGGGGLAATAGFVLQAFAGPDLPPEETWDVRLISVRTSSRAAQHQLLSAPRTWLRGPVSTARELHGRTVHDVGSYVGELEPARYLPRGALATLLDDRDVALVVAGSPALANALRGVDIPVVLKVATLVGEERAALVRAAHGVDGLRRRVMTWVVHLLDVLGLRRADAVIAVNPGMRDRLAAMTPAPVHLLPPGVDTERFQPAQEQSADGPIVMLGRLDDERKNIDGLVDAYAHARAVGVRNRLVLAGRNDLSAAGHERIRALGLEDHVDVLCSPTADVVRGTLRSASLFALASHEEGLGIVLLEAMASGLAVVATATRGASFVVEDGATGYLVPLGPDLADRFGDMLAVALRDPDRLHDMGRHGRRAVLERFSERSAARAWRAAVESVRASGRRRSR